MPLHVLRGHLGCLLNASWVQFFMNQFIESWGTGLTSDLIDGGEPRFGPLVFWET